MQLWQIAEDRVPFSVKGCGHSANPGFSSTTGVHISMTRFNDIVIREGYQTVEVGAGLSWTDVYRYLIPKGFNVVGGRTDGVGVAGLTLGGGESHSPPSGLSIVGLKNICAWQDILGKQTNMGSWWTPSQNSTLCHQMEREW